MKSEELRLLSLDGGGIRGLSELLILEEIMRRIQVDEGLDDVPKPCEYFDIIGGAGTGGLIAILLGRLRMSVKDAIDEYINFAEKVFSDSKRLWQDSATLKASSALEDAMKHIVSRRNESEDVHMMNDRTKRRQCKTFVSVVPALSMSHPRLFRSYEVRTNPGYNPTIWEAARATSATPGFFKSVFIGTEPKEEFINGEMKFNNPITQVLREAEEILGENSNHKYIIVSLGTGYPKPIALRKPEGSELMKTLMAIATDCEGPAEEFERRYGEGSTKKTYFRFNVEQGLQDVSLEEWKKMGEVKTHTSQYMRGVVVSKKIDRIVDLLKVRRVQEESLM